MIFYIALFKQLKRCYYSTFLFYKVNYLTSTSAPTSANLAFISSASSFETPSLIVLGAPSTISLASFNPNPVNSLTTLITLIFCAPALANTTSNSVFSSAAAAPPATAPATATGAAALTPNSSSQAVTSSFYSKTVISFIA